MSDRDFQNGMCSNGVVMEAGVAVAVPCYNQGAFLFECLNSLISQSMPNWEAVVVDDASTEEGIERIIRDYNDPRIRYVRHEHNRGLAASRNTGIKSSGAPYILCHDADDFLHPDYLKETLRIIEDTGCDCVFSDLQLFGNSNGIWKFGVKSLDELAEIQWLPAGSLMRRSVWESVGGYCESDVFRLGANEDWDFWISAMSHGAKATHIPKAIYFYRRHSDSMSVTSSALYEWKSRDLILNRHPEFFSVGDRAATFRIGGLLRSADANMRAGNYWRALSLNCQAIAKRPLVLYDFGKCFFVRCARLMRRSLRLVASRAKHMIWRRNSHGQQGAAGENQSGSQHWESAAPILHTRYGFLSHDFAVLDRVIKEVKATSVLEVGCGSGRLFPVYLKNGLNPILAQDISADALTLCQERFRYQKSIQYFQGAIEQLPPDTHVDLIVCSRVLQHILDDVILMAVLRRLAPIAGAWYINESSLADSNARSDKHLTRRDYIPFFESVGFEVALEGELAAENGTFQRWKLFRKRRSEPSAPSSTNRNAVINCR